MANFKRRRPRSAPVKVRRGRYYANRGIKPRFEMGNWPRWWDYVFHTRPKRAATREMERRVMQGDDPDAMAWPLGSRKPHLYFW